MDEDGRIGSANRLFLQMTNADPGAVFDRGLNDFLEATPALEHNAYGDGAVYRFSGPKGDRWLRPRRSRAHAGAVVMLIDVTSEWAMLGKLVSAVEVRDRLMRDADVGMWRFDPDTKVFTYSEAIGRRNNNVGEDVVSPLEEMVSTMHPDDIEREASLRERIISQGGTGTLHMRRRQAGWRMASHAGAVLLRAACCLRASMSSSGSRRTSPSSSTPATPPHLDA